MAGKAEEGVDLRTLRAIRVLRPLKLVSGVPSKFEISSNCCHLDVQPIYLMTKLLGYKEIENE